MVRFAKLKKDAQALRFPVDGAQAYELPSEPAHGFALLDSVYNDGTNWVKAQADALATVGTHLVAEVLTASTFYAISEGQVRVVGHGYTLGAKLYTSDATPGALTETEPDISNQMATVVDADTLHVLGHRAISALLAVLGFSGAGVTVAKGVTAYLGIGTGLVAADETAGELYVPAGVVKNLRAYISKNDTGASGNNLTVRKNGSGTALTVTWGSGETGLKTDTSNSFAVAAGDRLALEMVNAGSGGGTKDIDVEAISFELAP